MKILNLTFLILIICISTSLAQRKVNYTVGSTSCTIKFLPQGDMADFTGKVNWEDGTKTKIIYNQEQSTKSGKFVYLEYDKNEDLIGKFYFNDIYNKSGKYKNLIDGKTYKVKSKK